MLFAHVLGDDFSKTQTSDYDYYSNKSVAVFKVVLPSKNNYPNRMHIKIYPGGFRCIFITKRGLINYTNGSNKHLLFL